MISDVAAAKAALVRTVHTAVVVAAEREEGLRGMEAEVLYTMVVTAGGVLEARHQRESIRMEDNRPEAAVETAAYGKNMMADGHL